MSLSSYAKGGVDNRFFESIDNGVFQIPLCRTCKKYHFYPRVLCPHCSSTDLEWIQPTGMATVYSCTTVHHPDGDYNVSLVDLDEGPRLMSSIKGIAPDQVKIGQRVEAVISIDADSPLLVFQPITRYDKKEGEYGAAFNGQR